uniref:uncharacterized protein LOC124055693 isoform X1 n=1 Tax=Scatophagus argus TaxID=75038 RepID=UPI001ED7F601|nr:uncharacterized protein LOC124055693 isoform X1 [Scatophagus argus]
MVICEISTGRTRGGKCRLLYQHRWGFVNECDSRFKLVAKNQVAFLHLTELTPEDSGNYTCECSHPEGTYSSHHNIIVEGKCLIYFHQLPFLHSVGAQIISHCVLTNSASYEVQLSSSYSWIWSIVVAVATFTAVLGLVLGCIWRTKHRRQGRRSEEPGLSACETPSSVDGQYEFHKSLQLPECDLYQNISSLLQQEDAKRSSAGSSVSTSCLEQETDGETDQNCKIYENI